MKPLALAVALALGFSLGAHGAQRPDVDDFFAAMAIPVAAGEERRFIAGDNLAGYYEGYTHTHGRGEGYVMGKTALFQGYASQVDGVPNARAAAAERVLPYGHQVSYSDGVHEEMALLSKKQALALRVTSAHAALLGIEILLKERGVVTREDDIVSVACRSGFMAIAADQPFSLTGTLTITGSTPARALNLSVAFGASAQEAARRARALVGTDAIKAERQAMYDKLTRSYLATSDADYNRALNWAKAASNMFVVEQFGTGIWAGLPWFRDNWGRDTFIALPGTLLVSGQFADARAVLANFARYQNLRQPREREYGRIPNRVAAGDSIIYNTVDGTPWMLREALEYIRYTGDRQFARQAYHLALPYFEGALANYVDGDGLLVHDGADTWMDARIENRQPWSARGPRAVEIQALWYTALQSGAELATLAGDHVQARSWRALAAKVRQRFLPLFWDGAVMADRLREDASRDTKVRPNQLMLVSIPFDDFVPPPVQARVTRNAVSALLYPYGIASLSQDDPTFHPRHENPAYHHKDAAYHQGTVWGWNAGFTVTALNKFGYQDHAWALSRNLGAQILGREGGGTLGTMSELLDALPDEQGQIKPSGTFAQSWSVAEYARNAYQDYVGFRPNLPRNTLALYPAIPTAWRSFEALLPFGVNETLALDFRRDGPLQRWHLQLQGRTARTMTFDFLNGDGSRAQARFVLRPGQRAVFESGTGTASINGKRLATRRVLDSFAGVIGNLHFQVPKPYRAEDFPMLQSRDVLKGIVERDQYR